MTQVTDSRGNICGAHCSAQSRSSSVSSRLYSGPLTSKDDMTGLQEESFI